MHYWSADEGEVVLTGGVARPTGRIPVAATIDGRCVLPLERRNVIISRTGDAREAAAGWVGKWGGWADGEVG